MKDFKRKYIDKFAHVGAGSIFAFVLIAILTLVNIPLWIINVTTLIAGTTLAFVVEFYDQKSENKADEFDVLATFFGVLIILMIFNFF